MREIECPKCGREYASFPRMGAEGMFACPYCRHDALAEKRESLRKVESKNVEENRTGDAAK